MVLLYLTVSVRKRRTVLREDSSPRGEAGPIVEESLHSVRLRMYPQVVVRGVDDGERGGKCPWRGIHKTHKTLRRNYRQRVSWIRQCNVIQKWFGFENFLVEIVSHFV